MFEDLLILIVKDDYMTILTPRNKIFSLANHADNTAALMAFAHAAVHVIVDVEVLNKAVFLADRDDGVGVGDFGDGGDQAIVAH